MKTLQDITLYDLMAEDLDIWLTKSKSFGYDLQIDDENCQEIVNEEGLHPYATESLADFCRKYLAFYDKATESEAA
jgi:hypothetical protein